MVMYNWKAFFYCVGMACWEIGGKGGLLYMLVDDMIAVLMKYNTAKL